MQTEFDATKDRLNRAKHGLSLSFGVRILDDPDRLSVVVTREKDGEERFKAIGEVDGKVYTAVFTWRGRAVRMISVRRSNGNEERAYREN